MIPSQEACSPGRPIQPEYGGTKLQGGLHQCRQTLQGPGTNGRNIDITMTAAASHIFLMMVVGRPDLEMVCVDRIRAVQPLNRTIRAQRKKV